MCQDGSGNPARCLKHHRLLSWCILCNVWWIMYDDTYCKVQSKNVCTPLMGCWASYWGKTNMAHCITWVGSLTKLPANRALESDDKESCPPPKKYRQIPLIWNYLSANHITKGGLSSLTKWTCKRGTHGPDPAHTMSHAPLPHPLFSDYVSEHIIESRQARMIRPLRCDTSYIHKSICFQSNPIINKMCTLSQPI